MNLYALNVEELLDELVESTELCSANYEDELEKGSLVWDRFVELMKDKIIGHKDSETVGSILQDTSEYYSINDLLDTEFDQVAEVSPYYYDRVYSLLDEKGYDMDSVVIEQIETNFLSHWKDVTIKEIKVAS